MALPVTVPVPNHGCATVTGTAGCVVIHRVSLQNTLKVLLAARRQQHSPDPYRSQADDQRDMLKQGRNLCLAERTVWMKDTPSSPF